MSKRLASAFLIQSSSMTIMSFLLAGSPASAAFHPGLFENILSRTWALKYNVDPSMWTMPRLQLSVTVCFGDRTVSTDFNFHIVDNDMEIDVVFGSQWLDWCQKNDCTLSDSFPFLILTNVVVYHSLPIVDHIDSHMPTQIDPLSTHASDIHPMLRPSSRKKKDFRFTSRTASSSTDQSSLSGHAVLHDMFLSHCTTGVRASIFHCSPEHLRILCTLHGLHVASLSTLRDVKIKLLHHVINGDCFSHRCEISSPHPDRTACLCVASSFSSSSAITTFIIHLLKSSSSTELCTEDLLTVVESLGTQPPYQKSLHLR